MYRCSQLVKHIILAAVVAMHEHLAIYRTAQALLYAHEQFILECENLTLKYAFECLTITAHK